MKFDPKSPTVADALKALRQKRKLEENGLDIRPRRGLLSRQEIEDFSAKRRGSLTTRLLNRSESDFIEILHFYFEKFIDIGNDDTLKEDEYALRANYIRDQIRSLFSTAADNIFDDRAEFEEFVREVTGEFLPGDDASSSPPLPAAAPELYKERQDRKEKPEEFLRRVYEPWLYGKGLYRPHIRNWDPSLYGMLYARRNQISDFKKMLPPAQGRSVKDLKRSDAESMARKRKQTRDSVRKHRLKK